MHLGAVPNLSTCGKELVLTPKPEIFLLRGQTVKQTKLNAKYATKNDNEKNVINSIKKFGRKFIINNNNGSEEQFMATAAAA